MPQLFKRKGPILLFRQRADLGSVNIKTEEKFQIDSKMRKSNLTYQPFFGNNARTTTKSDDSAESVLNAPDMEMPFKVEPVKL